MNPEEARNEEAAGTTAGGALTLGFDEPVATAEKPKTVRKRVTKKTEEGSADAAEGSAEAAPARKPRAPRTTRAKAKPEEEGASAAPVAATTEAAAPSVTVAAPTPTAPAPVAAPVAAPTDPAPAAVAAPAQTVAPAPTAATPSSATTEVGASGPAGGASSGNLVSQLASLSPTPRYAPSYAAAPIPPQGGPQPSTTAEAAPSPAAPSVSTPATAAEAPTEGTFTRDPSFPAPAANAPGQGQVIPPYQPRGRYAPIDPANPGSRHSNQRYGGSFSGGPIQPVNPEAQAEAGNPPEAGSAAAGQEAAPFEGQPADFTGNDPRQFQRDPLRFRGGRAQMRAERNMARGRHLRPGQPGYVQGQGQGGNEGQYGGNNQQGNNRGRREYDLLALEAQGLNELHKLAEEMGIEVPPLKKEELIHEILGKQAELLGNVLKKGILEILPDGKGFLRCNNYSPDDGDVYVSQSQIKRFNLKTGDTVTGTVRQPKEMERYHGLLRVEAINGFSPETMKSRRDFEKLTPIFPNEKFQLETDQVNVTARIIDLVSPIGKGQRGLIVAPPKAGKTTLIKNVANSIMSNHPEVMLIVLLIDERPEEVTDISRSVRGEVVASTFDEMPENHMRVADMVLEKAKRWVELKHDVVILLDSITRLSRASNLVVTPSGRTLSGGLDPAAMYRPKRMFGAARNIEEGGSLTILATALVDTGSRMDEMIFEEFKGTGNMDLVLDRSLFDQRIFPAIDINKSGTRRDDLLMSREDLAAVYHLRRTLAALDNDKAVTLLIDRLKNTKTNADFMQIVAKSRQQAAQQ